MARRAAWWLIGAIGAILVLIVVAGLRQATGDPGALTEILYPLPPDVPAPAISDVSTVWGVDVWKNTSRSQLSGGASLGDLDGDGLPDLVVAGGTVAVFLNDGSRFNLVPGMNTTVPTDALSSVIGDLDGDRFGDIVIRPESGNAVVIWGGPWLESGDIAQAETSSIPGGETTTGVLAADLDADGMPDLVLLGYGSRSSSPDTMLFNKGERAFTP
jgi:hypothetical protein